MTFREYENLQVGDKVRLPFSCMPDQIVVKAEDDEVTTVVEGESAHALVFYVNRYEDLEPVGTDDKNGYPGDWTVNRIHTRLVNFYNVHLKKNYSQKEHREMAMEDSGYDEIYPEMRF